MRARLAGWLLVLAYACTLPSLLPAAFAALARVEGSHGIELRVGGEETELVLTHPGFAGKAHDAIHHHGLLAKMLTAFAEPPRSDNPDHHLKFTGGTVRCLEKRAVVPDVEMTAEAVEPKYFVIAEIAQPRPALTRRWPESAPPRPPAELVELASTLLLI